MTANLIFPNLVSARKVDADLDQAVAEAKAHGNWLALLFVDDGQNIHGRLMRQRMANENLFVIGKDFIRMVADQLGNTTAEVIGQIQMRLVEEEKNGGGPAPFPMAQLVG